MKTLSLRLPEGMYGDLAAVAESRGVSKSVVIREALSTLLRAPSKPVRGSAFDLVEDLVGTVEGSEDLSSNPAYLEDLGR